MGFFGGKLGGMAAKVKQRFFNEDDSLLLTPQDDEALISTGTALDDAQRAAGLAGAGSAASAAGMVAGLLPGGSFVQAFCDGVSAEEKGDDALEKLLKYPSVRKRLIRDGKEPTLDNLKQMITEYNTQLDNELHNTGKNMEDGMLSSGAGLLGGAAAAALVPGGFLVSGAAAVAGGLGSSALMDYARGIRNNDTNIPAMLEVVTHYEAKGGRKDATYYALLTALTRLNQEQQEQIECMLGMSLEQALIERIKGEEIQMKGGKPPVESLAIEEVMLSNGTKDPSMDVDAILRDGTGEQAGRGLALAGDSKQHVYKLAELYQHYDLSAADMITSDPLLEVAIRRDNELKGVDIAYDGVTVPRTPTVNRNDTSSPDFSLSA